MAQCHGLCSCHERATLALNLATAPGRRDDTKVARNPSRGGGRVSGWDSCERVRPRTACPGMWFAVIAALQHLRPRLDGLP